jgi:hypothetical protein
MPRPNGIAPLCGFWHRLALPLRKSHALQHRCRPQRSRYKLLSAAVFRIRCATRTSSVRRHNHALQRMTLLRAGCNRLSGVGVIAELCRSVEKPHGVVAPYRVGYFLALWRGRRALATVCRRTPNLLGLAATIVPPPRDLLQAWSGAYVRSLVSIHVPPNKALQPIRRGVSFWFCSYSFGPPSWLSLVVMTPHTRLVARIGSRHRRSMP